MKKTIKTLNKARAEQPTKSYAEERRERLPPPRKLYNQDQMDRELIAAEQRGRLRGAREVEELGRRLHVRRHKAVRYLTLTLIDALFDNGDGADQ